MTCPFNIGDVVRKNVKGTGNDDLNIPVGSIGTVVWVDKTKDNKFIYINWEGSVKTVHSSTYRTFNYNRVWGIKWTSIELINPEERVLDKIKYLNERKQLDKSRIVPPQGIYRGSRSVQKASTSDQSQQNRSNGSGETVQDLRQLSGTELAARLHELLNTGSVTWNRSPTGIGFTRADTNQWVISTSDSSAT